MSTLLVASSGGHLAQLHQLRPRLYGIDPDVTWVTFDTPQSRALLAGEDVVYVTPTSTRDYLNVCRNTLPARRLLRDRRITSVVSTGAGIALSFLPLARAHGIDAYYIESATRAAGPSATGKLLSRVPGIELFAQHPSWADDRWQYRGSVFDGYEASNGRPPRLERAVVTLGAHRGFGFRRLVERLLQILPPEVEVLWQTGGTDITGLGIEARPFVPAGELDDAVRDADVVVSHAGIGSTLAALEAGRRPVILPRDPSHGEHVDDHQLQIADELGRGSTTVVRTVEDLALDDLLHASSYRVSRASRPPQFALADRRVSRDPQLPPFLLADRRASQAPQLAFAHAA